MPGLLGMLSARPPAECERTVRLMLGALTEGTDLLHGRSAMPALGLYAGWAAAPGSFAAGVNAQALRPDRFALVAGEVWPQRWARERLLSGEDIDDRAARGFNGQFSALIADGRRQRLVLFNDRYGMERIYLYQDGADTYFASEAKAILRVAPRARRLDDRAMADLLCWGSVLHGRTLFRGMGCLAGGTMLVSDGGAGWQARTYDSARGGEQDDPLEEAEFVRRFVETCRARVAQQLNSAPIVGLSITGGLDSRMVMACLPDAGTPAVAYTYAGSSDSLLDARIGAQVAAACGVEHRVLRLAPEFLTDFGRFVDRTVLASDGCAGALAAHEVHYSDQAAQLAPVRVTGNYGSEILRGVSTFKPLGLAPGLVHHGLAPALAEALRDAAGPPLDAVRRAAFQEVPWHMHGTWAAARSRLVVRAPFLDNDLVDLALRAPSASRARLGVEAALVCAAAPRLAAIKTDRGIALNGARSRLIDRIAAELGFKLDYLHKDGLSGHKVRLAFVLDAMSKLGWLDRHKFLSYRRWFRFELAAHVKQILLESHSSPHAYFEPGAIERTIAEHSSGRHNRTREIGLMLQLEATQRLLCGQPHAHLTEQT